MAIQKEARSWQGFGVGQRVWDTSRSTATSRFRHPPGTVVQVFVDESGMVVEWDSGRRETIKRRDRAGLIQAIPEGQDW